MPVTLKDIADQLNVSIGTVSMALRDSPRVNKDTRHLVQETATRLGYTGRSRPQDQPRLEQVYFISDSDADNVFYGAILQGAEMESRAQGLHLTYVQYHDDLALDSRSISTGLIVAARLSIAQMAGLLNMGRPLVMVNHELPLLPIDCVLIADYNGMYRAVDYLYGCGHRAIAHMSTLQLDSSFRRRLHGYRAAMSDLRLKPLELYAPDLAPKPLYRFVREYAEAHPTLPFTAVVASHDMAAIAALNALQDAGLRVPEDVSVMGFDDVQMAEVARPTLTTCRVPRVAIGECAVCLLLDRSDNPDQPTRSIALDTTLVERQSVASADRQRKD